MEDRRDASFDFGDDTEIPIYDTHFQSWFMKRFASNNKKRSFLDGKKHLSCMKAPTKFQFFDDEKWKATTPLDSYDKIWNDIRAVNNDPSSDTESSLEETDTTLFIKPT